MLIAVTGASGFVGQTVVRHLRGAGFTVRAISRSNRVWQGDDIEAAVLPGFNAPSDRFERLLAGADHVVHGAALTNASPATPESEYMEANAQLTARFAEAAARVVPGRFLFLSSIRAVVGSGFNGIVDISTPPEPTCAYGRSKRAAELEAVARYAAIDPPRLSILRLPPVYGRGMGGNLAKMLRLADTPYPLPVKSLNNRRSLLSVEALAAAVVDLLGMPRMRPIYLASDRRPVSTAEMFAAFRAGLGRPERLLPIPADVLKAAARIAGRGDAWQGLLAEQICDSSELANDGWRRVEDPRPGLMASAEHFERCER
jgi:UDP-glucose 4-epimerase